MNKTQRVLATCLTFGTLAAGAAPAHHHAVDTKPVVTTKEVGGAPMFSNKNIIQNAVNSKDHTHLVDAVKAANLAETLSGPGPFTVFAPDNAAFEKIPKQVIDGLMAPGGHPQLSKILTYHVVAGKLDAKALAEQIKKGKGSAKLKTVAGGILTAKMDGSTLTLTDEASPANVARATIVDVYQSNGVIHSIDTVMMPK